MEDDGINIGADNECNSRHCTGHQHLGHYNRTLDSHHNDAAFSYVTQDDGDDQQNVEDTITYPSSNNKAMEHLVSIFKVFKYLIS